MIEDFSVNEREEPAPAEREREELATIICKHEHPELWRTINYPCPTSRSSATAILAAGYSKSRSTAITDAMVQAAIKSRLCQACIDGLWSREPSSCVDCVRTALTDALSVSGRSPAEVPPNWPDEVQEARLQIVRRIKQWRLSDMRGDGTVILATLNSSDALDALCAAVWRSAQQ